MLWTGKRDLSDEIVSIIFLQGRKPSTDLTDVKRKKIFVSVSPGAEIATKSSATTVGAELMFILKDDKGRPSRCKYY